MFPIRDTIRSLSVPLVTWLLIGLNVLVFVYEASLPEPALQRLLLTYGVVPERFPLNNPFVWLANPMALVSLFTHMFLHGSWLHLISNMWSLFIFGDNVEDRMGSGRFLAFYLLAGLAAAFAQIVFNAGGAIPAVGASGAIAGVLGAYFLMFPRARVISIIPLFFIPWFVEVPAIFYLGFWFVSQIFSGIGSLGVSANIGGVAFWAHIGGFVFGMIFYRFFIIRRQEAFYRQYPDEYFPY